MQDQLLYYNIQCTETLIYITFRTFSYFTFSQYLIHPPYSPPTPPHTYTYIHPTIIIYYSIIIVTNSKAHRLPYVYKRTIHSNAIKRRKFHDAVLNDVQEVKFSLPLLPAIIYILPDYLSLPCTLITH
jgi:hypothetical protein